MTRKVLALVLLAVMPAGAAQWWTYEAITVANTAIGLSDATINPAGQQQIKECVARLETAQIRYRLDAAPTSTDGIVLEVGDALEIKSAADAQAIRFIRTGATSGSLKVQCWR